MHVLESSRARSYLNTATMFAIENDVYIKNNSVKDSFINNCTYFNEHLNLFPERSIEDLIMQHAATIYSTVRDKSSIEGKKIEQYIIKTVHLALDNDSLGYESLIKNGLPKEIVEPILRYRELEQNLGQKKTQHNKYKI